MDEPGVHPAVNDGVVHGIAHGEPVDDEIDVLDRLVMRDVWTQTDHDEVDVLWQPTDGEYHHDKDHHLHNLHPTNMGRVAPATNSQAATPPMAST